MNSLAPYTNNMHSGNDRSELREQMLLVINDLWISEDAGPFKNPVDTKALGLENYLQIIKNPMDLTTIKRKIRSNRYKTVLNLLDDVQLIWNNCKTFNADDSLIFKQAQRMEKLTKKVFKAHFPHKRLFKHPPQQKAGSSPSLQTEAMSLPPPVAASIPALSLVKTTSKSILPAESLGASVAGVVASSGKESESKSSKGTKRVGNRIGGSGKKNKGSQLITPDETLAVGPISNSHHLEKLKQDEIFLFAHKVRLLGNEGLVKLVRIIDSIDPEYVKKTSKDKFTIKIQEMDTGAIRKARESLNDISWFEPDVKLQE